MILNCKQPNVAIPNVSYYNFMLNSYQKYGNKVALIDGETGEKLTYQQLHDYSKKLAASFAKIGLSKGDILVAVLPNCLEYLIIYLATSACGAIFSTCNPNYTKGEVTAQLKLSQPKFVVVQKNVYPIIQDIAKTVTSIKEIVPNENMGNMKSIRQLIRDGDLKYFPQVPIDCSKDLCLILYSSGTTGLPKGVMLTHRNIVAGTLMTKSPTALRVAYCVLPFFHSYGTLLLNTLTYSGDIIVIHRRFSLDSMYKSIETNKISYLPLVPPLLIMINKNPVPSKYNLSSLQVIRCGAAPVPRQLFKAVGKKFNVTTSGGWALTEAVPLASLGQDSTEAPLESSGLIGINSMLKVVDPTTGKTLGPFQRGEFCVKGPQVMLGYHNNEKATKQAIDNEGWLHTGDIGYFDENEFIFIVDRMKELIKYKGFQVAPAELEHLLLQHPKVSDAGVIGIPDKEAGEVPKAFLVKKDGSLVASEIHEFIKGKLSSYKFLRGGIEFIDEIPKGATGKILRRELKRRQNIKSHL